MKKMLMLLMMLVLFSCAADAQDDPVDADVSLHVSPTGRQGETNSGKSSGAASATAMLYHGGPIIRGTTKVYYIWYGNWAGNTAVPILTDLASTIGGSPYFGVNTTYYDSSFVHVTNSVQYAGSVNDSYSQGTSLTDAQIAAVVSHALLTLGTDQNGVYFVLTSADVTASSGFCTQYCGWHTYSQTSGVKYAFVGNPDRCPANCSMQVHPNGNAGADGMASIIAHELEESVTDPHLNAWYDRRGYENADKCAWTFGTTYAAHGSVANVHLGSRDFLIQQNWVNTGSGRCALHL